MDEAVVRRLIAHVGGRTGTVYGRKGKSHLRQKIDGFNQAARYSPWVVLADLDMDADCAPTLLRKWLPSPANRLCLRFAVREVEAWLMADRETLARFLSVPQRLLPNDSEGLERPKQALVSLCRQSRSRAIRADMVPRPGSGRDVGPAYTSRLVEFASAKWQPAVAAERCNSLKRAVVSLRGLAAVQS